jgi:sugar/nucleoside kinase (ribokinase family)
MSVRGLFVGLTTVDAIFGLDRYPLEDSKTIARRYTLAAGGPASNAAVVFGYLGGRARLVSGLGRGVLARIAHDDLRLHGIEHVDLCKEEEHEPALSAILTAAETRSRTICTTPAIARQVCGPFDPERVSEYLAQAAVLLLDGHELDLAIAVAQVARQRGVPVVLDGDLYAPAVEDLLPLVDTVIFGKSFVAPDAEDTEDLFAFFRSFGVRHVAATRGQQPLVFLSEERRGSIAIEPVEAVDTLGAGDVFHGAFCYSLCRGRDFESALRFAARVATASVTRFGTRTWMEDYKPSTFG